MSELTETRIPLAVAAENLAKILHAIDEGDVGETIAAVLDSERLNLSAAVSRRVVFFELLSSTLQMAEEKRDAWKRKVEQLKHVEKRIKDATIQAMQIDNTVKKIGEDGNLCLQDSPPALVLNVETSSRSFGNIISDDAAKTIPQKYLVQTNFLQLNTAELKKDLDAGIELPFASLKRGVHLRIRI
jgi:hypothetical protein